MVVVVVGTEASGRLNMKPAPPNINATAVVTATCQLFHVACACVAGDVRACAGVDGMVGGCDGVLGGICFIHFALTDSWIAEKKAAIAMPWAAIVATPSDTT